MQRFKGPSGRKCEEITTFYNQENLIDSLQWNINPNHAVHLLTYQRAHIQRYLLTEHEVGEPVASCRRKLGSSGSYQQVDPRESWTGGGDGDLGVPGVPRRGGK